MLLGNYHLCHGLPDSLIVVETGPVICFEVFRTCDCRESRCPQVVGDRDLDLDLGHGLDHLPKYQLVDLLILLHHQDDSSRPCLIVLSRHHNYIKDLISSHATKARRQSFRSI